MAAKKSAHRVELIERIVKAITKKEIYKVNLKHTHESELQRGLYERLQVVVREIVVEQYENMRKDTLNRKVDEAVRWEREEDTTITNYMFLGAQHRPDFEVILPEMDIAIEVKIGDDGESVRSGLGQSLVYSTKYDFTICLFADSSDNKSILRSSIEGKQKQLLDSLWQNYNIRFVVV